MVANRRNCSFLFHNVFQSRLLPMRQNAPYRWEMVNPFSAELFQVESSMFKLGRLYFHVIWFLEYLYNSQPNNADVRWDSSLRADSPESALFAKSSILPLALKELRMYDQKVHALSRAVNICKNMSANTIYCVIIHQLSFWSLFFNISPL